MMMLPFRLPGFELAKPARCISLGLMASIALLVATAALAQMPGLVQAPASAEPPARAQEEPVPPQEQFAPAVPVAPDAAAPAPPASSPGLIDAFGRFIENGVTTARDAIGGIGNQADTVARGAADAAGSVAKGAAEAVTNVGRLPTSLIARGREQCQIAPNGAPDCRTAAEALCRANGLTGGKSIDFQTAEKCPVQIMVSDERTPPGTCTLEHFVTRALCQ
jgi:hypothetical protein